MNITDNSLKLFLKLAEDAIHWNGQPMLDDITKEQHGITI